MKTPKALAMLEPFLRFEEEAGIAIIRLTDDILRIGEEAQSIEALFAFLEALQSSPARAVLWVTTRQCFSRDRCDQLRRTLGFADVRNLRGAAQRDPMAPMALNREERVFSRLVGWFRSVPKPVVMAFRGEVEFPFLGLGLACEYRLAAGDTVFYNRTHEVGIPPGGGLLYMLPAYVGMGRATSLLLRAREITSDEALELGLVDQLAPDDQLVVTAEIIAAEAARTCAAGVGAVKRLLNHHLPPLDAFFRDEMLELDRATLRPPPPG